jgi:hypothetical protein
MSRVKGEIAEAEAQGVALVANGKALLMRYERRKAALLAMPDSAERAMLLAVVEAEIADVSERLRLAESAVHSLGRIVERIENTGRPKGDLDPALVRRVAETLPLAPDGTTRTLYAFLREQPTLYKLATMRSREIARYVAAAELDSGQN